MKLVTSIQDLIDQGIPAEAIDAARTSFSEANPGTTEADFSEYIVTQARQTQTGYDSERFVNVITMMVRASLATFDNIDRVTALAQKLRVAMNEELSKPENDGYTVIDTFAALLSLAGAGMAGVIADADAEHAKNCPDCAARVSSTTGFIRA